MGRYLPLIFKNALRNRRRSLLTILSIAASFCLLGMLMAVYQAFFFSDPTPEQALRLVTRHKVSLVFPMPMYYADRIRQVRGVREVMASQWFGGVYKDNRDPDNLFARFAVEPEKLFTLRSELKISEAEKASFVRERSSCIIGRPLAERFGLKVGDRIQLQGDIFPVTLDMPLAGIFDANENNEILYFHLKALFEAIPASRRDLAGTFGILADSPESVTRIAREVDALFENAPDQTKTESERNFQLSFLSFLGNVKVFLISVCAAVTFTILLVSANTMAMSVRERVREVGILKTLGFTPGAIFGIILAEAALLSLCGGLLGSLMAGGLCVGVREAPAFIQQLKTLTLEPQVAGLSLLLAVVMALASSFVPAWSASRTSILDALRTTD